MTQGEFVRRQFQLDLFARENHEVNALPRNCRMTKLTIDKPKKRRDILYNEALSWGTLALSMEATSGPFSIQSALFVRRGAPLDESKGEKRATNTLTRCSPLCGWRF
jgi:hypothetical protein